MKKQTRKTLRYKKRKARVKAKVFGTKTRPRLTVFRSNQHIYGQIVDDEDEKTLVSASDLVFRTKSLDKANKVNIAAKVGENLAVVAIKKKIKAVVFDRNGFKYHGRVKALADAARKGGLEF